MASPARTLQPPFSFLLRLRKSYIVRRTLNAFFKVFLVTTLIFFLIRLMPASPVDVYINLLISQYCMPYEEARNMAAALFSLDLDAPLHIQYIDFLLNLLKC